MLRPNWITPLTISSKEKSSKTKRHLPNAFVCLYSMHGMILFNVCFCISIFVFLHYIGEAPDGHICKPVLVFLKTTLFLESSELWRRTNWSCLHICIGSCIFICIYICLCICINICICICICICILQSSGEAPGGHVCISVRRATRKGESCANQRLTTEIFVKHFQIDQDISHDTHISKTLPM